MPTDLKITELPAAGALNGDDVGILANNKADYQFTFTQLLKFIKDSFSASELGSAVTFVTEIPQNYMGKDGDIVLNTSTQAFYQKTSGIWTQRYQLPTLNSTTGGQSILYGIGVPSVNLGKINDTYINTATGAFYQKSQSGWSQVFTMLNGPAGGPGPKGETGSPGVNGKTILHGSTNPSNLTTGSEGDFYINTTYYTFFGPKTNGSWGEAMPIVDNSDTIGNLNDLQTTDKNSIVAAINELKSNGGKLSKDIKLDVPLGALSTNDILKAGSFDSVISQITTKIFYPGLVQATYSISKSASTYQEINTIINNLLLTISFTKGSYQPTWTGGTSTDYYGAATGYRFYIGNGSTPAQEGSSNTYKIASYQVSSGSNIFKGEIDYAQGQQAYDSKSNPYQLPIPANTTPRFQNTSLTGIYPWFYGSSSNNSNFNIYTGNKVVQPANNSLTIPFNSTDSKYQWFAHDATLSTKTTWAVTELNKGSIGGLSNLFGSPVTVTVTAPASASNVGWSKSYKLYITNYATSLSTVTIS